MHNILRFLIRIYAFVSKELVEVLRQTPLILTLVLGPFLIMLLFGIGFRNEARPLRTLFVVPEDPDLRQEVEDYATSLGPQLIYEGMIADEERAMNALKTAAVDVVVVIPADARQSILNDEQAVVNLYHNEIDPSQVGYIELFGSVYIDEMNRRILRSAAQQGQEEASTAQERVKTARLAAQKMRQALEAGDAATAQNEQQQLNEDLDMIDLLVQGSLGVLGGMSGSMDDNGGSTDPGQADAIQSGLDRIGQNRQELGTVQTGQSSYDSEIENLREMEADLEELDGQLTNFQSIEPHILVAPFTLKAFGIENVEITWANFFAPAVVILLLQHLAVTFGALSIVREQRSGTMELFRISPLSAFETLAGKYLSYLLFGAGVAAIITSTIVFALKVPILGAWQDYALVTLVVLFTSLGMGFLISLIAKTDLQAVQYAMFLLLGSVFFGGFLLDIRYLWEPVRIVSWSLPATYGIRLLQNIMLRGTGLSQDLFLALLGIGVVLFIISWFIMRLRLQREWS